MSRKLVQINTVFYASTGKIMRDIQGRAEKEGYETISFVGRPPMVEGMRGEIFGNSFSFWSHVVLTTIFDAQGYGSYFTTRKLINRLREEEPDIIHLHNLHGYYLNIPLLCKYLAEEFQGKIFWTFHDCWSVTGHCAHFVSVNCQKWKNECYQCKKKTEYPISLLLDGSRRNYYMKKSLFTKIPDVTIMVPSEWMRNVVKQSFLGDRDIRVVNNGINLNVFRPNPDVTIWDKYGVSKDKKIVLGVASVWSRGKGLQDFLDLSAILPDDYCIVLVGLNKGQIRRLPPRIIGIGKTKSQDELAKIYSCADVFVNPSVEESFSLVTVESMACGTPVVVLDTSAVKELVTEECGIVLGKHSARDYMDAIEALENQMPEAGQIRKCAIKYSVDQMLTKVMSIYDEKVEG